MTRCQGDKVIEFTHLYAKTRETQTYVDKLISEGAGRAINVAFLGGLESHTHLFVDSVLVALCLVRFACAGMCVCVYVIVRVSACLRACMHCH